MSGYSDTVWNHLVTVTVLPVPEGVTVSGQICTPKCIFLTKRLRKSYILDSSGRCASASFTRHLIEKFILNSTLQLTWPVLLHLGHPVVSVAANDWFPFFSLSLWALKKNVVKLGVWRPIFALEARPQLHTNTIKVIWKPQTFETSHLNMLMSPRGCLIDASGCRYTIQTTYWSSVTFLMAPNPCLSLAVYKWSLPTSASEAEWIFLTWPQG